MSISLEMMIAQEREALMKVSDQELIRQFLDLGRQFSALQILLNEAKEASKAVDNITDIERHLEDTDRLLEETNEEPEMKSLNEESFKSLRENLDEKLSNLLEEDVMDTVEEQTIASDECQDLDNNVADKEVMDMEEAVSQDTENFKDLEVKLSNYGTNIEKKKPVEESVDTSFSLVSL